MPAPLSTTVTQDQYDQMLVERATKILANLQDTLEVSEAERIQLNDLPDRPELWQQVYDIARAELSAAGITVHTGPTANTRLAPTYVSSSQPSAFQPHRELHYGQGSFPSHVGGPNMSQPPPAMAQPPQQPVHQHQAPQQPSQHETHYSQAPRTPPLAPSPKPRQAWDIESLRDTTQAVQIATTLYQMCQPDGSYLDSISGLRFADEDKLQKYKNERETIEKELHAASKEPPTNKMLRRAWFNTLSAWQKGSAQETRIEQSGFDVSGDDLDDLDDAEGAEGANSAFNKQTSNLSLESDTFGAGVAIDESQTHCALTGEEFEKTLDEDSGQWVYKDTTRDSQGRIVIASAYYEQQAKKRQREDSQSGQHGDAADKEIAEPSSKQQRHS